MINDNVRIFNQVIECLHLQFLHFAVTMLHRGYHNQKMDYTLDNKKLSR